MINGSYFQGPCDIVSLYKKILPVEDLPGYEHTETLIFSSYCVFWLGIIGP